MANPIDETDAKYLSKLSMNGTAYTIKDAWARAEIDEVKSAISGGTHFLGLTTTEISDGSTTASVVVPDGKGGTKTVTAQAGDIVLHTETREGTETTIEYIFGGTGFWQEFGPQGIFKALAYKDSASGTVDIPLSSNISAASYTPQVSKGTLYVTTVSGSIGATATDATFDFTSAAASLSTTTATATVATEDAAADVSTTATAASLTYTATTVTAAGPPVSLTYTTGTFTALKDVTYDDATATLSISSVTSDAFTLVPGVESVGDVTVTYDKTSAVTYDKTTAVTYALATGASYVKATGVTYDKVSAVTYDKASGTFLSQASLDGDLTVTAAAPTLTITNPTVTVTVS